MAYTGTTCPIPLGQAGLRTDDPQATLPANAAIVANNISLYSGKLLKGAGSTRYNTTGLGASIICLHDYWPTPTTQRLIAATADGKIWKDTGDGTFSTGTAITTGLGTLTSDDYHMCAGGAEATGQNRKLFIFSSVHQVRVLTADGGSTAALGAGKRAADWASYYPTFGIIYQNRMVCFGNSNDRHRLYISALGDHEDFQGATYGTVPIFSGEGDGLVSACVYKGSLLLFKKPFGVYIFTWNGQDLTDPTNYSIERFSDSFGIASQHAVQIVNDDLLGGDNALSVKSLKATSAFGSLEQGDVFSIAKVRDYMRSALDGTGMPYMHTCFYPEKEIFYMTGRSSSTATAQDRIVEINMSEASPKISLITKDTPVCMTLRRDSKKIQRPIYGSTDGYVYLMDQANRNVNSAAYTGEFQTPYTDLSFLDGSMADKVKLFDFIQLTYIVTGIWSFYVDIYVDGEYKQTISFSQGSTSTIDDFELDVDRLGSIVPRQIRHPLKCSGKTISFRVYNSGLNESFSVERLVLGFRVGSESNRSS